MSLLTLRRVGITSLGVISVLVVIGLVFVFIRMEQVDKLNSLRDTRLSDFDRAQSIAVESLGLLTIGDQKTYISSRDRFRKILSEEIWDDYFSNEGFVGSKKEIQIHIYSVSGEFLGGSNFIFKLEYTVRNGSDWVPVRSLITIRGFRVTDMRSID